jgi:hypothetical protein
MGREGNFRSRCVLKFCPQNFKTHQLHKNPSEFRRDICSLALFMSIFLAQSNLALLHEICNIRFKSV